MHQLLKLCACAGAALICDTASASIDWPRAQPLNPIETTARANDDAARASDEALRQRVQSALHADPYFYDRHVKVAVKNGQVTLHGFVFSDWDLRNAVKIARDASGGAPVSDDLTIKEGGRR
ncbi:MAG TPA: BON domain-containing protein [Steroidobacteraceae bacterium]